ncbi:MAG: UDP-N-acetylmuramoyl-L-alanyl-D-glutamate--2,6-diaminopimelate ligase [Sneathiella sp.]
MRLTDLFIGATIRQLENKQVEGLTADSREVKPGFVFAALSGVVADGASYIKDAIENGAVAIVTDTSYDPIDCPIYCYQSENPRLTLATIASRFYDGAPEHILAVTGTNGKTSVAHFIRLIWQSLGLNSASLGTLGIISNENASPLSYTTPDPVLLHKILSDMVSSGVTHAVIEASSHGLDQYRLDAVKVSVAGFTNLSRDHLDYHSTFDAYLNAKLGLVRRVVEPDGCVVLNADSDVFAEFKKAATDRGLQVLSYGYAGSDIKLKSVVSHHAGQKATISVMGRDYVIELPLVGEFQVLNILCAIGMVIGSGADISRVIKALDAIENVPGRLEKIVNLTSGASVYVDFAHTPDALETVLNSLRPHTSTNIHVVVGCGGDRDKGKRSIMGAIAGRLADKVYVTDDNPRTEDAATIRSQVLEGCPAAIEIGDRRDAIQAAMRAAKAGDIVLVAGKGHESGQIVGTKVIPFNDNAVVKEIAVKEEMCA